jgi:hypothetical protein
MADIDKIYATYIVTALWAEQPEDDHWDPDEFAPEAVTRLRAEVETFTAAVGDALDLALDLEGKDEGDIGHDLWLTRNRHGAGFWDGDWPMPFSVDFHGAANALGECDIYRGDDGLLYLA